MADPRTHVFANNAASLLDVGIDDNDLVLHITPGTGVLFPSPTAGEIFKVTLQNLTTGEVEICNCTARSSDTLTVERGQEDTDAIAWAAGALVHHRATAETFEHLEEAVTGDIGQDVYIQLACSNLTSELEAGANKAYVRAPRSFTLTAVRASLLVASSYGPIVIDINKNGSSILSTKLSIDDGDLTSVSSGAPPVISDDEIISDDLLSIDFDAVELEARGVIVTLIGTV